MHRPTQYRALRRYAALLLGSLTIYLGFAAIAKAEEPTHNYAVAAQPLSGALTDFADQSDLKLMFPAELARGITSPGVTGALTRDQALARLFAGTGMTYRYTSPDTVTLERPDPLRDLVNEAKQPLRVAEDDATKAAPKKTGQDQPTVLEDMTVTATPVDDTGYSAPNATTATKTDTPIMETPVSIQVLTRQVMDDQQVTRLEEALKNISSLQPFNNWGGVYDTFVLRGFLQGFDINTTIYRDGIRLTGYPAITAGLERIEVLKGPASVLYGRVEPGGLVNLVTKKPLFAPYYSLQQQFGSFELYRTSVDATGPVPVGESGNLLYRFNLDYLNRDTFRDFVSEEQIYVAPRLTWNISDSTWLGLGFEFRHQNLPAAFDEGIPAIGTRPAKIPVSRNLGDPNVTFFERDNYIVNLDFSHSFNPDWNMDYRGMYARLDWDYNELVPLSLDETAGELSRLFINNIEPRQDEWWYTSLDVTGHIPILGMGHTLLIGADYYRETKDAVFGLDFVTPSINIFNPIYGFVPNPTTTFISNRLNKWYGVYVQDQVEVTKQWHLLLGGRFDFATSVFNENEIDTDRISPRFGVVYSPWPWLSLYGHYAESFGLNFGQSADRKPFEPSTAEEYEVGVKAELWGGRLVPTLAFYELTKGNIPTPDPNNSFFNILIGEAQSRGIEFDVTGYVTDALSLIGSYAYTDVEITKDSGGNVGHRLPNVPRHAGSLWAKYEFQPELLRGLSLGGGAFLVSQREGDNANSFQLPGYVRVDAFAAYKWKLGGSALTAQLNINNLLDKEYFKASDETRVGIMPGEPLTVIGSIRVEF